MLYAVHNISYDPGDDANVMVFTDDVIVTDSPVIIQDPQSKHRREGEDVTLCCQTEPSTGVAYKW